MPYLPVEIDALEGFENVATMVDADADHITRGMLRLWEHCWRMKGMVLPVEHLRMFIKVDPAKLVQALEANRFAEDLKDGTIRIRGGEEG